MMEMLEQVTMLFAGAVLGAFAILLAVDVAILLRLRASFPQHPVQNPRAQ